MKTKAVIYCRFSPRPGADACESNEVQLAACRDYCAAKGYTIVGEFSDEAASGDDPGRVGLWDAVTATPRRGVLIVHKLDRLARSTDLSGYIRHTLGQSGGTVEAADGTGSDETPELRLMRVLLAGIAEYQKQITSARTRAAMLHAQSSGRAMSKIPPFGWERVGKELRRVDDEQRIVRKILALRGDGLGFRPIARALGDAGLTCRGKVWRHSTIKSICRRAAESSPVQS